MADTEVLLTLRNMLARFYPKQEDARRVLSDIGVDPGRIEFSGVAVNFWQSIFDEVSKTGQIDDLLVLALEEYGGGKDYRDAYVAYYRYTRQHAPSLKSDSSPMPEREGKASYCLGGREFITFVPISVSSGNMWWFYRISHRPVTNVQYREFVRATDYAAPSEWSDGGTFAPGDGIKATKVTWEGADAFCSWLATKLDVNCNLPSGTQWANAPSSDATNFVSGRTAEWLYKPYKCVIGIDVVSGNRTPLILDAPVGATCNFHCLISES